MSVQNVPQAERDAFEELLELSLSFTRDIRIARTYIKNEDSQFHRRNLIRLHFAFIEGHIYTIKAWLLHDYPSKFSSFEQMVLSETEPSLKDNGELRMSAMKLSLLSNMKFTFKSAYKSHGLANPFDTSSKGWQSLQKSLSVRHRLTHPKNGHSMHITDEELADSIAAFDFFTEAITKMFRSIREVYQAPENLARQES